MDLKPDQEKVKVLLIDTISLLCRSGLSFNRNIMIQGVIGITVDRSEVFLVHINQELSPSDEIESVDVSSNCNIGKNDGTQPQKPYENKLKIRLNNSKVDSNRDSSFYISQPSDDASHPRRPLTYQPSYDSPAVNVNNANNRSDDDNRSLMFTPRIKKEPGYSSTPYHSGQGHELSDSQQNICSQNSSMNDSMLQMSPFKYDIMNFSSDFNALRGTGSSRRASRRRGGRRGGTVGVRPVRMDGTDGNTSWDAMVTTSFMCKVCGQSFVHKSNLLGHQIRIHGRQKNKRGRPPSNNNNHSIAASQVVTTTNNYIDNSGTPFSDFPTQGPPNLYESPTFDTGYHPNSTPNSQHYPVASQQPPPPLREESDDDDDLSEPREVQQLTVETPSEPHFDYSSDFHHNGLTNQNYPTTPRW